MDSTSNLICSYCSKHLKTNAALSRHEKVHLNVNQKICNQCPGKMFVTKNDYLTHLNVVHNNKIIDSYICSECGKQFKSKSELNNHTNSKCGTMKLYKCKVCCQELMNPGSLHNHMLKHTGGPSFMCRFCAKLFLTAGQLKVHERIHTQEKPFICNICGKGFCHRQSLITHSTLHTGIKPYSCENCGHSFSCVGNLLKHRKTHIECGLVFSTSHRVTNPLTKMKVKVNTPISAKLRVIGRQKEMQKRLDVLQCTEKINTSGNDKKDEVNNEGKHSSNQRKLLDVNVQPKYSLIHKKFIESFKKNTNHQKNKHLNDTESKLQIKLKTEDVMFTNTSRQDNSKGATQYQDILQYGDFDKNYEENALLEHEKDCSIDSIKTTKRNTICQEDTGKSYKCSCCPDSFSNQNERKIHQIRAHAELLTCQDCDKNFTNPDSLRTHRNTFHKCIPRKTYTYICEYCGKQFKQKSALIIHNQNKCAEGPQISCEVCHRKFSSIHVRKSHMRIHNSEKNIFCKFCGKTFHWKGQLKIHERRHTGEKPFTCLYCPKAFAYRESLITHSSLHTGIKPHLCEACGSRFSCVGNLIKHRTTHANTCGVWFNKIKKTADAT